MSEKIGIAFIAIWMGLVNPMIASRAMADAETKNRTCWHEEEAQMCLASHEVAAPVYQVTCFLQSSGQPNGMTKACYYDCLGSPYTHMVKSYEICSPTITVNM